MANLRTAGFESLCLRRSYEAVVGWAVSPEQKDSERYMGDRQDQSLVRFRKCSKQDSVEE